MTCEHPVVSIQLLKEVAKVFIEEPALSDEKRMFLYEKTGVATSKANSREGSKANSRASSRNRSPLATPRTAHGSPIKVAASEGSSSGTFDRSERRKMHRGMPHDTPQANNEAQDQSTFSVMDAEKAEIVGPVSPNAT